MNSINIEHVSSGKVTLIKEDSIELKESEDNHNEIYSHISTNHHNTNTFTLPPRLETVIETMSEQSLQRSLLKSINKKVTFPNDKGHDQSMNDEKIENLKMVMSIRKLFKEDANGKFIRLLNVYYRHLQ